MVQPVRKFDKRTSHDLKSCFAGKFLIILYAFTSSPCFKQIIVLDKVPDGIENGLFNIVFGFPSRDDIFEISR
jgi:hypothetical protein